MGWTFSPLYRSTVTAQVVESYTWDTETAKAEVLAHSINVRRGVAYLAVRTTKKATGESSVWAGVALIKYIPRAADGYVFGIKEMDETAGPNEVECPARILDLLTPLPPKPVEGEDTYEYARAWRDACRKRLEGQKSARKAMRDGATVTLPRPVRFTNGVERQTFTVRGYTKHIRGGKTRQAWRLVDQYGDTYRLRPAVLATATVS